MFTIFFQVRVPFFSGVLGAFFGFYLLLVLGNLALQLGLCRYFLVLTLFFSFSLFIFFPLSHLPCGYFLTLSPLLILSTLPLSLAIWHPWLIAWPLQVALSSSLLRRKGWRGVEENGNIIAANSSFHHHSSSSYEKFTSIAMWVSRWEDGEEQEVERLRKKAQRWHFSTFLRCMFFWIESTDLKLFHLFWRCMFIGS